MNRFLAAVVLLLGLTGTADAQIYGANPPACVCEVATRASVLSAQNVSDTQAMSRTAHFSRDTITSLQLVFWNGFVSQTTHQETGTGGTETVTASIEYPLGTLTQVKFSGVAAGTAASLAVLVSDQTVVSIPTNTQFWDRNYQVNPAGIIYNGQQNAALGDRLMAAASGIPDLTTSGTVSNDIPGFSVPPTAIIATTQRQSYCLVGTSRTFGTGDTVDGSGDIGLQGRSIGPGSPYINMGIASDQAAAYVLSHAVRVALANDYCTTIIVELGINDDQSQLATLEANLQSIWGYFPTKRVYAVTTAPYTTSTDSFATTVNQTVAVNFSPLNDYVTPKPAPLFGVFDVAPVLGLNGKWRVNGTANYLTADGIHPMQAGYLLVQSSGQMSP